MQDRPKPQHIGGAPSVLWSAHIRERISYVMRRKAPEALVEALYSEVGEVHARKVDFCGSLWSEYQDPAGGHVWHLLRCKSRWCPYCGSVWQRELIRELSEDMGVPEDCTVTMMTVTTGRRVQPWDLRDAIAQTVQVAKLWRRRTSDDVAGGVYSIECAPPGDAAEGWHVHLHMALVIRRSAPWLIADRAYINNRNPSRSQTTPALVWAVRSWSAALRDRWRARYDELPLVNDLMPSVARPWGGVSAECPARVAVVDIGGRWPSQRAGEHTDIGSMDPRDELQQVLKYAVKPADPGGPPVDRAAWIAVINAMSGRRRAQTWGCWYGRRTPEPEETDADEDPAVEARSTGTLLFWTDRARARIVDVVCKAFVYGARIESIDYESGWVIVKIRQDLDDGG